MSTVAKLKPAAVPADPAREPSMAAPAARGNGSRVARDFAVLLGAALTIGVTAAAGMVLAVLLIA